MMLFSLASYDEDPCFWALLRSISSEDNTGDCEDYCP